MNSSSRLNRDRRADSFVRYVDETLDIVPPPIDLTPFMEPLLDNVVSLTCCIYCGRPMADVGTEFCSSACAAESEGEDRCNDDYDDDGRD